MKIRNLFLIVIAIFFTGCGSNIDKVKDGFLFLEKTLTIGEAIDNYQMCDKVEWKAFESSNGVNVVEARCDITKKYSDAIDYFFETRKNKLTDDFNKINEQDTNLRASSEKNINEQIEKVKNNFDNYGSSKETNEKNFAIFVSNKLLLNSGGSRLTPTGFMIRCIEDDKDKNLLKYIKKVDNDLDSIINSCIDQLRQSNMEIQDIQYYKQLIDQITNGSLEFYNEGLAEAEKRNKMIANERIEQLERANKELNQSYQINMQKRQAEYDKKMAGLQRAYSSIKKPAAAFIIQFSLDKKGDGINLEYGELSIDSVSNKIKISDVLLNYFYKNKEFDLSKYIPKELRQAGL